MIINSKAAKGTKQQWQDSDFREKKVKSSRASMLQRWNDDREKMLAPLQTEEFRAAAAERGKAQMAKQWADSEYREKMLSVIFSPENIEKRRTAVSKSSKERWQDSEYREKILGILNNPEVAKKRTEAVSAMGKTRWQDPEYREKMLSIIFSPENIEKRRTGASKSSKERWQNPEYREKMSRRLKERWQDPIYRESILSYLTSEENIEKIRTAVSKAGKERWQDEEYRLLMAIVNKAAEISWDMHPECSEIYKEVAKDFPSLAKIINKQKAGDWLSDFEQGYSSTYFKTCHDITLQTDDGEKSICRIIGETQKSILSELGFYEKDRDIQKIAELMGIEQKGNEY